MGKLYLFLKSVNVVLYLLRSNSPKNCGVLGFWWFSFFFFCRKVTAQGTVGFRVLVGFFLCMFSNAVPIMDGGNFALPVCRLKRAVSWPLSRVAR